MASNAQAQQINVSDLDISQLADVRRQLEEVRGAGPGAAVHHLHIHHVSCARSRRAYSPAGTQPPYELVHATQAGAVQVQGVHRERGAGEAGAQGCVNYTWPIPVRLLQSTYMRTCPYRQDYPRAAHELAVRPGEAE